MAPQPESTVVTVSGHYKILVGSETHTHQILSQLDEEFLPLVRDTQNLRPVDTQTRTDTNTQAHTRINKQTTTKIHYQLHLTDLA